MAITTRMPALARMGSAIPGMGWPLVTIARGIVLATARLVATAIKDIARNADRCVAIMARKTAL